MWTQQVHAFASRFEVIRYDPRGTGRSTFGRTPARHAADLAALLDVLGVQRTAVVTIETGAEVALEMAAEQPQRVGALVLTVPIVRHLRVPGPPPIVEPRQVVRTRAEQRQLWGSTLRLLMMGFQNVLRDLMFAWPRSRRPSYSAPWLADVPVSDHLAEVVAPTCVVLGEWTSPRAYARAELLRTAIPTCQIALVPRASLYLPLETPQGFNRVVLGFLSAYYLADVSAPDAPL
jgi:non-heme chloroperoxidase